MKTASPNQTDVRLDASQFLFAILDVSKLAVPRDRRNPTTLGYLFEASLPVPIESVHAVYLPINRDGDRDRVLACGMPAATLREHAGDALTLGPASLPTFASDLDVEPAQINLLTGVFEPRPIQKAKRSLWLQAAAAVLLCAVLLSIGLERRAQSFRRESQQLQLAANDIYREVLPPQAGRRRPNAIRLTAELRRLRQTRTRPGPSQSMFDAGLTLAGILAAWPSDHTIRTTSISITEPRSTINALAEDTADAQQLIDALSTAPRLRVRDSSAARQRDDTAVRVTLEPATPEPTTPEPSR